MQENGIKCIRRLKSSNFRIHVFNTSSTESREDVERKSWLNSCWKKYTENHTIKANTEKNKTIRRKITKRILSELLENCVYFNVWVLLYDEHESPPHRNTMKRWNNEANAIVENVTEVKNIAAEVCFSLSGTYSNLQNNFGWNI